MWLRYQFWCNPASLGIWFPVFWHSIEVSTSRVLMPMKRVLYTSKYLKMAAQHCFRMLRIKCPRMQAALPEELIHLFVSTMIHLPTCIIKLYIPLIGLNSLRRLRLQDNLIQQLPEEALSDLEALEQLSLRKNQLSTVPPKLFSHLIHLKHLDLSNNWISSVLVFTFEISTSRIVSPLQITENYSNRWPIQSNTGVVKVFSVKTSQELLHIYRPERERLGMLKIII